MVIDSNVIVNQPITIESAGVMVVNSLRVMPFSFSINCVSSMYASGQLKWNNQGDTPESWTGINDTPETWNPISVSSESWGSISDTPETWTPIADVSEVWETV